jgi:DivIVA domain-containing protein
VADFLLIVIAALVLAGIVFGAASFTLGRDRGLTPPRPDGVPFDLPPDRPLDRADISDLRFDTALRGYRMDQVDQLLARVADDLDFLYTRIADLEDQLAGPVEENAADEEPEIELPPWVEDPTGTHERVVRPTEDGDADEEEVIEVTGARPTSSGGSGA